MGWFCWRFPQVPRHQEEPREGRVQLIGRAGRKKGEKLDLQSVNEVKAKKKGSMHPWDMKSHRKEKKGDTS